MTPWQHYVIYGRGKGNDNGNHPSDDVFFPEGYKIEYSDVGGNNEAAWHHYAVKGYDEGRDNGLHPSEDVFFPEGYLEMYPDVAESKMDPWQHYVKYGKKEGRDNGLHPDEKTFYQKGYLELYSDVAKAEIDPWKHYVLHGKTEGRNNGLLSCSRMFFSAHEDDAVKSVYLTTQKLIRDDRRNLKRVLLIGYKFSLSGDPAHLLAFAQLLISHGYSVDIAISDGGYSEAIHMYDGIGADVFLLPESGECFPQADRIIRNYNLVIVNTISMWRYADLCRKLNVPHIWFIRDNLPRIQRYFLTTGGGRQSFFDDHENILCASKFSADQVFENYGVKCGYINDFINDRFSAGDSQNKKHFGRIAGGVKTFAVVGDVQHLASQIPAVVAFLYISVSPQYKDSWKLLYIGKCGNSASDPALGLSLESITKNIPNIEWRFGDSQDNREELFDKVDFFIVPSVDELSSTVAIEAAMLGKPVILSNQVGAKHLVEENAGFIFESGNTAELRKIIIKCLDMADDEYMKMSCQIRLNYEKTSLPSIYFNDLSSVINDVTERCHSAVQVPADPAPSAKQYMRTLGVGANVSSLGRLKYFKFIDFGKLKKQSSEPHVKDYFGMVERGSKVGVVVPVYNGVEHLKILIPSLFKNTDLPHKFVFVDDCSNKETADFLSQSIRGRDDCILITNERNLGFVKSVNRGASKALEYCGNFVMLNSDTEVPSGWLSRLMHPIFEDEKVSSVTPLSNRCTFFSFPYFDNDKKNDLFLKEFGLEGINEAIRNSCIDRKIDVYSGHGFCMAVSGKAWCKTGGLNSELFGRGYGEENEWSFRSELDGFKNILITTLYVAHHEKGSFSKEEKESNCAASQKILNIMYPVSMSKVTDFVMEYPLADSIVSIFISLAKMQGLRSEIYADLGQFVDRISGKDGIIVFKGICLNKLAVKLLGEVVFVDNARNLENTGIFSHGCIRS